MPNLPTVSAKLVADVEKYITDIRRAERASKGSFSGIDKEIDKLGRNIRKKFSAGDIGKDLMRGLGIGGGFQLAQNAVEAIAVQWEKAAEAAKRVEESTARQVSYTEAGIKMRQTDAEREVYLRKQIESTARQLGGWKSTTQEFKFSEPGKWAENFRQWLNDTNQSELATEKVNELTEALGRLGVELEALGMKRRKEIEELGKTLTEYEKMASETTKDLVSASSAAPVSETLRELRANASTIRFSMMTMKGLDQNDPAVLKAQIEAHKELEAISRRQIPLLEREHQLYRDMGQTISSSFEDAIFASESLSDAIRALGAEIMKLIFRQSITSPLSSGISGLLQNLFGLPGVGVSAGTPSVVPPRRASGGPVSAGQAYTVGEFGQELFVPTSNGRIIPHGATGNTYNIDARGTDESVVMRLQQALFALAGPGVVERRALSAHAMTLRRGGGAARAIGA